MVMVKNGNGFNAQNTFKKLAMQNADCTNYWTSVKGAWAT